MSASGHSQTVDINNEAYKEYGVGSSSVVTDKDVKKKNTLII